MAMTLPDVAMTLPDVATLSDSIRSHLIRLTFEFQELLKLDIFTSEHICEMMAKLISLQSKLNDDITCVPNWKAYLECQLLILNDISTQSIDKPGVNAESILMNLTDRLKKSFKEALEHTGNIDLYDLYLKFCIKFQLKEEVLEWCMISLQKDITNEIVWNLINKFYTDESDDIRPTMWTITTEFASKFIAEIVSRKGNNSESRAICMKKLIALFKSGFKYIPCCYFHIALLDGIKDDDVLQQLLYDMRDDPYMWNAVAQRTWRVDIKKEPSDSFETLRSSRTRLDQSIAKYKEGITSLSLDNKHILWRILVTFLFTIFEDKEVLISAALKANIINTHLIEGLSYFSEDQFLKWLELETDPTAALRIADKAIAIIPTSEKLWSIRLRYEFTKEDNSNARPLFKIALSNLPNCSAQLWEDVIRYSAICCGSDTLEEIYWDGCKQHRNVSSKIRPQFLEWIALQKPTSDRRAMYEMLIELEPLSIEMHFMNAKLESLLAEEFDETLQERIYVIACTQFSEDIQSWLAYVRFLFGLMRRNGIDVNERVQIVRNKSMAALPVEFHEKFNVEYQKLIKEHSVK